MQVDSLPSEPPEKPHNTGVGCPALLQGIFPTQGLNPGFPHCRQILYWLSCQGCPRILYWVAYPFSTGSSWTRVSCIAGGFFNSWSTKDAQDIKKMWQEYTEEPYKKDLNEPDNHNGVIPYLEPDILEYEVKWTLRSITTNKAISAELFQKMMLL